ncbi:hypothetical protein VTJ83DRAFT_3628 [Remersonia thermophila]|uniref:Uncharacterized protein n=1 Tax=Remersonia thermophila TaxID=72144 RepID=A0ABR4DEU4_9PEZI
MERTQNSRLTPRAPTSPLIHSQPRSPPRRQAAVLHQAIWTEMAASYRQRTLDLERGFSENVRRLSLHSGVAGPVGDESHARTLNSSSYYFQLPNTIRLHIMRQLLKSHGLIKPIRMNSHVFLRSAWPVTTVQSDDTGSADYFESLEHVLTAIQAYTSVCAAMRADVLATLFLVGRFHVVFSPFMSPATQPAATKYMDRYGPLIARITLEVDFTKLSGGKHPEAVRCDPRPSLARLRSLVETFVDAQLTRQGPRLGHLRILVRRYRCDEAERTGATHLTPDAHVEYVLSPIKCLGGHVTRLTIIGGCDAIVSSLLGPPWSGPVAKPVDPVIREWWTESRNREHGSRI